MAWVSRWLKKLMAREFNRPDFSIVDHHTYVFMGDGCMMEGVSTKRVRWPPPGA